MAETAQLEATKQACCAAGEIHEGLDQAAKRTLVLLATDHLGKGNDDLGRSKPCRKWVRIYGAWFW